MKINFTSDTHKKPTADKVMNMKVIPHLILRNNGQILLAKRALSQKLWAKHWHCVTGKIEAGETPRQTIVREAMEEIGINLNKPPELVTTISIATNDVLSPENIFYALELFFIADLPNDQVPFNQEPLKQDAVAWFEPSDLPKPMIPAVKFGLECFLRGQCYGEFCDI